MSVAECPLCGKTLVLTRHGEFLRHGTGGKVCRGSWRSPASIVARMRAKTETRPCAELGCKVPVTRPSGTGRWPERCPEHRAQHIAAESARRVAESRARRGSS